MLSIGVHKYTRKNLLRLMNNNNKFISRYAVSDCQLNFSNTRVASGASITFNAITTDTEI